MYLLQQHKTNGINGKVRKHMGQPGAVDGIQFLVEPVEDHTACNKPRHNQQEKQRAKPADHHCHMVKAEGCSAEDIGQFPAGVLFQIGKHKTPEEKFFQK